MADRQINFGHPLILDRDNMNNSVENFVSLHEFFSFEDNVNGQPTA